MHNLAVAIGEGVPKRIISKGAHTAVITTGAMSACIYEKSKVADCKELQWRDFSLRKEQLNSRL